MKKPYPPIPSCSYSVGTEKIAAHCDLQSPVPTVPTYIIYIYIKKGERGRTPLKTHARNSRLKFGGFLRRGGNKIPIYRRNPRITAVPTYAFCGVQKREQGNRP